MFNRKRVGFSFDAALRHSLHVISSRARNLAAVARTVAGFFSRNTVLWLLIAGNNLIGDRSELA